jgi:hypothetical protein
MKGRGKGGRDLVDQSSLDFAYHVDFSKRPRNIRGSCEDVKLKPQYNILDVLQCKQCKCFL